MGSESSGEASVLVADVPNVYGCIGMTGYKFAARRETAEVEILDGGKGGDSGSGIGISDRGGLVSIQNKAAAIRGETDVTRHLRSNFATVDVPLLDKTTSRYRYEMSTG